MADIFVDRRKGGNRNTAKNRHQWLDRLSGNISARLQTLYLDAYNLNTDKFVVNNKSISTKEYRFAYDRDDGVYKYVFTGNDTFKVGDKIPKPEQYGGSGGYYGSSEGHEEGYSEYTAEELEEMFLGDIILPNLVNKGAEMVEEIIHKGGYSKVGSAVQLSVKKSYKESLMRRNALMMQFAARIEELKELLEKEEDENKKAALLAEIKEFENKQIPLFEKNDLRYRSHFIERKPVSRAVIFFLMDVSGSMGKSKRAIAKLGCYFLNRILRRKYGEKLETVFIKHTMEAQLCTEREFFGSEDSGGTVISTSVDLMSKVIRDKYRPEEYNIYAIQLTDGENFTSDDTTLVSMITDLLPSLQLYSYIAIDPYRLDTQNLMVMKELQKRSPTNFKFHIVEDMKGWKEYFNDIFVSKDAKNG